MNHIKTLFNKIVVFTLALTGINIASKLSAATCEYSLEEIGKLEKKVHADIKSFIKRYQGGCFTFISVGMLSSKLTVDLFGLWVTAKTKETIDTGRALALKFTNSYFSELQSNKNVPSYYEYYLKKYPTVYSGPLSLKNIEVRIAFWDDNVERPKAPYLAEIDFHNGKFLYYQADPKTQALQLVLEESYDDAITNLTSSQAKEPEKPQSS